MKNVKLKIFWVSAAILLATTTVAMSDWEPNDGHKMHFPQLPDVNGWDVWAAQPLILADDWTCSKSGWITSIHFWGSVKGDMTGTQGHINISGLRIYSNVPDPDPCDPNYYSQPGELLWSFNGEEPEPVGIDPCSWEGWYDPNTEDYNEMDHTHYYLYNISIPAGSRFHQNKDTIYWLAIQVYSGSGMWGWKTADVNSYPEPYTGEHYMDDAVWSVTNGNDWFELRDPITDKSLDLAFVIEEDVGIPTVTEWGLVVMALGLVMAGAFVIMRRQRAAA